MRPLGLILAILSASLIASYPEYAVATVFSNTNTASQILDLAIILALLAVIIGVAEEYYAGADLDDLEKFIQGASWAVVAGMRETSGRSGPPATTGSKNAQFWQALGIPQGSPSPPPPPPPEAGRYCPSCGQGNAAASAFCSRCGKPLPSPP